MSGEPVTYMASSQSSRSSSPFLPPLDWSSSSEDKGNIVAEENVRSDSPPLVDDLIAEMRNEQTYRYLLTHEYSPSRESVHQCNDVSLTTLLAVILPLWDPSPVDLGAVGYLSKPRGRFITLFNAFSPQKSDHGRVRSLPPIYGYGQVKEGSQKQDKRNSLEQRLDAVTGPIAGWLRSGSRGLS